MRKTKLCKKGKQPISRIQRKLWKLCREICRKKYPNVCYTCGATGLGGSNWHTSHLWPKAALGAYMKYDLRILRPSCYHCNINLGGNGAVYYAKMLKEIGQEKMEQLEKDRQIIVKSYDWYLSLIPKYTDILNSLKTGEK